MRTKIEKEYLIRAIDSFKRKIIVISQDFMVLAANQNVISTWGPDIVGKKVL